MKMETSGSILNISNHCIYILEGHMNSELLKQLPKTDGLERTELLNILLSEEYGFLPGPPVGVTADVESEDRSFCAGKAVLKKLKLNIKNVKQIFRKKVKKQLNT